VNGRRRLVLRAGAWLCFAGVVAMYVVSNTSRALPGWAEVTIALGCVAGVFACLVFLGRGEGPNR
jgi:peptidoglycan/LPS O-acetylase OafA/YrhL